jgi:predicted Rossmann fold flavoprotein
MVIDLLDDGKNVQLDIDLKPGLTAEQLDARMLRDFKESPRRNMRNIMKGLLPVKLADFICGFAGISFDLKANQVTSLQRKGIVRILKGWRMEISGSGGIEDAMITRGGVSLKEINPRTMESRLVKGLYFCGEMIDVDADTGGFNLQAAFSTGYLAGESAA